MNEPVHDYGWRPEAGCPKCGEWPDEWVLYFLPTKELEVLKVACPVCGWWFQTRPCDWKEAAS